MPAKLLWLTAALLVLFSPEAALPADSVNPPRQPVLVELFTSEGCSTCPPADALLEKLDRDQPIAGAQIIVLSEHVDYWNHDGWTDPYSAALFTTRQQNYVRRFGLPDPYTPEMVIDGSAECVGGDRQKVETAIRQAIGQPKVGIRILPAPSGDGSLTLEVDPLPAGKTHKASVYVASAADSGTSNVLSGENRGRLLHHVSIVADIRQVGSIGTESVLRTRLSPRAFKTPAGSRLIAFVQESGDGRVWGAAVYAIPAQSGHPLP